MTIVLIGPVHPHRGGIAHHTALLARSLAAAGHDVHVIAYATLYPRALFPGRTTLDPSDVPLEIAAARLIRPLWPPSWWRAATAVLAARPDLVVVQWWVPYFAPALGTIAALIRRGGARLVFICHNVLPHDGGGGLDRALVRAALARGAAWVVHSSADGHALRALLGPARFEPAGAGRIVESRLPHLDLDPVGARRDGDAPVLETAASQLRVRHGVPPGAPLALFFGFVRPYKGLMSLVDALPIALRSVGDLHVLVAGEFWQEADAYRRRAAELGVSARIRFDDRYIPNEEVAAFFAAADVCVLPYREATQSAIVPQAFAAGVPVIATRVGGLPEAVADGESGLLVPPDDPAALAGALARFFGEPGLAERLRAGARAAGARFDWAPLVEILESLAA